MKSQEKRATYDHATNLGYKQCTQCRNTARQTRDCAIHTRQASTGVALAKAITTSLPAKRNATENWRGFTNGAREAVS